MKSTKNEIVVDVKNVSTTLKGKTLHKNISLSIYRGEIVGLVGASGSGKSVLLRSIIGLLRPDSGTIESLGENVYETGSIQKLREKWGVLFQSGALLSSLSVGDNIRIPMREIARIPLDLARELTALKLYMVGLPLETATKFPSELSGGMIKRVALARTLAIDPEILFLDEPTSGLDPISACGFDQLILDLQKNLDLTVLMVTHDLDSLLTVCDRIAVLVDQQLIVGTAEDLKKNSHPWIQEYFQRSTSSVTQNKG